MADVVIYPVVLSKDGDYIFVRVPDIDGGYTQGNDEIDAMRMAQDLIGNLLEDANKYPKPSEPSTISLKDGEKLVYVAVDMTAFRKKFSRTVRKNITIPEYLNSLAKQKGVNVSAVATEALEAQLCVK